MRNFSNTFVTAMVVLLTSTFSALAGNFLNELRAAENETEGAHVIASGDITVIQSGSNVVAVTSNSLNSGPITQGAGGIVGQQSAVAGNLKIEFDNGADIVIRNGGNYTNGGAIVTSPGPAVGGSNIYQED